MQCKTLVKSHVPDDREKFSPTGRCTGTVRGFNPTCTKEFCIKAKKKPPAEKFNLWPWVV